MVIITCNQSMLTDLTYGIEIQSKNIAVCFSSEKLLNDFETVKCI